MNERQVRYKEKINFIVEKIASLPIKGFDNDIIRDATLYKIQVAIECMMDISAMLVKDIGKNVGDDYHNLEILVAEKIIDEKTYENLRKLNGLRNVIVHRYNKIEEDLIFNNIQKIKKIF